MTQTSACQAGGLSWQRPQATFAEPAGNPQRGQSSGNGGNPRRHKLQMPCRAIRNGIRHSQHRAGIASIATSLSFSG
ncbi:hypothetical protein FB99_33240 [Pantoea agglomerans]|nr:hypothetical protein FB99_33240 [Pantoea agglomerans]